MTLVTVQVTKAQAEKTASPAVLVVPWALPLKKVEKPTRSVAKRLPVERIVSWASFAPAGTGVASVPYKAGLSLPAIAPW
jgi:hypothetical protein